MIDFNRFFALRGWSARLTLFLLGAIAVLGHAPFHLWALALIGFAALFAYLRANKQSDISGFWMSFYFALGYFLAGTFWIGSAFIARGPEFIPVMPPMVLGLSALLALFWGWAGMIYKRWAGEGWRGWVALIGLFLLAELARGHVFGGFPWNLPGYVFKAGTPLSQLASPLGIYGLSGLVFAASATLAVSMVHQQIRKPMAAIVQALVLFWVAGYLRLSQAEVQNVPDVNLRIVQVSFDQKDRFDRAKSIQVVNQFLQASVSPGIEDTTHLIWPEGAVIGLALENPSLMAVMGQALTETDATPPIWLLNTLRHEQKTGLDGLPQDQYFNTSTAISFDPLGVATVRAYNDKWRLVPFGEIIPGGRLVEQFGAKTISSSLASLTPAPQKDLAQFPGLPMLSPQICYEIIFPGLTPQGGAKWILNQSNDAWFGGSTGPHQHANIAAYRAIENGLPVVRSASNGVSGVIDPYGRYQKALWPSEGGVIDAPLPQAISGKITLPYAVWTATIIGLIMALIGLSFGARSPRHERA